MKTKDPKLEGRSTGGHERLGKEEVHLKTGDPAASSRLGVAARALREEGQLAPTPRNGTNSPRSSPRRLQYLTSSALDWAADGEDSSKPT